MMMGPLWYFVHNNYNYEICASSLFFFGTGHVGSAKVRLTEARERDTLHNVLVNHFCLANIYLLT